LKPKAMLLDPPLLAAFVLGSLVVIVSPGPDILYVVSRSVGQGRRAGVVAVAGISTGLVAHGTAAVLGLSSLFAHAPLA
jgi:threonine/homoserine/homoserine lactone efflux protein